MRDREIAAWAVALALVAALSMSLLFNVRTNTRVVHTARTAGLKKIEWLNDVHTGVNGKGRNVTVKCTGWWDPKTPPLNRKVGAENGQYVLTICEAWDAGKAKGGPSS